MQRMGSVSGEREEEEEGDGDVDDGVEEDGVADDATETTGVAATGVADAAAPALAAFLPSNCAASSMSWCRCSRRWLAAAVVGFDADADADDVGSV